MLGELISQLHLLPQDAPVKHLSVSSCLCLLLIALLAIVWRHHGVVKTRPRWMYSNTCHVQLLLQLPLTISVNAGFPTWEENSIPHGPCLACINATALSTLHSI